MENRSYVPSNYVCEHAVNGDQLRDNIVRNELTILPPFYRRWLLHGDSLHGARHGRRPRYQAAKKMLGSAFDCTDGDLLLRSILYHVVIGQDKGSALCW